MLTSEQDTLGKRCLIGLTYFDIAGEVLKQSMLAGKVIKADKELGITLALFQEKSAEEKSSNKNQQKEAPQFIIPGDLSCWFVAPKGTFDTSQETIKITDPDYLITWDIHQTKADKEEGEQQWWQWVPRTAPPQVG